MKTLKPAKYAGQLWRGACTLCEAEFEATYDEIKKDVKLRFHLEEFGDNLEIPEPMALVKCPECCHDNAVMFKCYKEEHDQTMGDLL